MIDYDKIAEGVQIPEPPGAKPAFDANTVFEDPRTPVEDLASIPVSAHTPVPLNDPRYQGIAEAKGYSQESVRLKRVSYSHEAMIDVLIAEPTISQGELAKRFHRSEAWISVVMGSDSFQGALAKRRDDVCNPFLQATIEERFRGMVSQSLDVISEKLSTGRNIDVAFKALDIGSKALGFGARAAPTAGNTTFVVNLPPKSANADEWAKAHSGQVIEG